MPAAQIVPVAIFWSYPALIIEGKESMPIVTTVAPTIPVEAARSIPTITTPIPNPPLVDPKSSPIDCKRPAAIFVFSNMIPINIKRGTATSGSFIIVPKIL